MSDKSNTKDMRELEYEVIGSKDQTIAHVWWNGKKVDSDSPTFLSRLDDRPNGVYTVSDGTEYLKRLPQLFRNGYIRVRRVK